MSDFSEQSVTKLLNIFNTCVLRLMELEYVVIELELCNYIIIFIIVNHIIRICYGI